jgi:tetratricopeptide (TPR) repeat protein
VDDAAAHDDAERYFLEGYEAQMQGRLDEAIAAYRRSLERFPTAEAHTFLGWTLSFRGDYEGAILECHRAIEVDPDFGNPYNDIGSYLIALGRHAEAIPWLHRAIAAKRYQPRHYPHVNLARIHLRQSQIHEAIAELKRALALEPRYQPARRELHRLLGLLN